MCSPVPQPPSSQGNSGGKERGIGLKRGAEEESRKGERGTKTNRQKQKYAGMQKEGLG